MSRPAASSIAAQPRTREEARPTWVARLTKVFRRPKKIPVERSPLDSATKVLIANLMSMR
jgi:hypothetical protein